MNNKSSKGSLQISGSADTKRHTSSIKEPRPVEGSGEQTHITVEAMEEDLELLSRVYGQKSRRTMVEQNPHFKRSIIQSILRPTANLEGSLAAPPMPGSATMLSLPGHASNDQDRSSSPRVQGIQTILVAS